MCPGEDCHGTSKKKAIMGLGLGQIEDLLHLRTIYLEYVDGMRQCWRGASAPIWIFKGTSLPYRVVTKDDGSRHRETAASILPCDSLLATRHDRGG